MTNVLAKHVAVWIACALCLSATASGQTFDRNAWLRDYATLKQALEKRYSNLAWFASAEGGVDLPALDRRTLAALRAARTDDDARTALLSFVRSFHDGHFSQLAALQPPPATKSVEPPRPEYTRQDAATGCAALNYAPYDRPSFSLPLETIPGFRLLADGITTPFRAGILTGGEPPIRVGIIRIAAFEENSDQGLCLKAWTRDEVWDANGKLIRGALQKQVERAWYNAIAELLRTFNAEEVAAVLVDVGNNSGGDDSGDIAARMFTTKPLRSAALWMTQDPTSSGYFDEQLEALRAAEKLDPPNEIVRKAIATFVAQKEQLTRDACDLSWVWRTRREWSSNQCRRLVEAGSAGGPLAYLAPDAVANAEVGRLLHWPSTVSSLWGTWSGPLYVLTDGRTYSSAEMFAAVLQNNGAAKTVGSRTGGDGCGFMTNPGPVILPHSRLRFRVPNCVRMRADGTDEVAGVKPDIPILATEGERDRARALRVFEALRADVTRR